MFYAFFISLLYLQVYASDIQKIQWIAGSDKNFEQAKRENRFVILDLEAVRCHVMNQQTYGNPKIIAMLNAHFIPVKVDQDSRPDLSNRYQDYGWPATIIFNAKGEELVMLAGYVPPDLMMKILKNIMANPVTEHVNTEATQSAEIYNVDPYLSKKHRDALTQKQLSFYDEQNKGWGGKDGGQKYLDPDVVEYAMTQAENGDTKAEQMAKETLNAQIAFLDPEGWDVSILGWRKLGRTPL